jgi:Flp pilus assembly protein CpaB
LRAVAVIMLGVAAWLTVSALRPHQVEPGVPTVVATRDLPLGSALTAEDLRVEQRRVGERPETAFADVGSAVGQVLSGPVLAGEIVTPVRFRGPPQLAGLTPGLLVVSVPVPDPILLGTIRPADTVAVLAAGSGQPLATAARVLATDVPTGGGLAATGGTPGHLVLAVSADEARGIAVALGPSAPPGGLLVALRG